MNNVNKKLMHNKMLSRKRPKNRLRNKRWNRLNRKQKLMLLQRRLMQQNPQKLCKTG